MSNITMTREMKLAYLGGLFDGEGSAGVYQIKRKHYPNGSEYKTHVPTMQIRMCDPEPVAFMLDVFPNAWHGTTQPNGLSKAGLKKKVVYEWRSSHKRALTIAIELYPYLINEHKKAQVASIIKHYGVDIPCSVKD